MNRNPFFLILLVFCTATLVAQTQPPTDTLLKKVAEGQRDSVGQPANPAPNLGRKGSSDSLLNIRTSSETDIHARLLKMEKIQANLNKEGTVKLKICIGQAGEVISVDFVPQGSTTEDKQLIEAAIENALKWEFATSETEKECGTIVFTFRVK
ncbi:MAG: hypothetical protein IPN20_21815 [Haliscomenobacter sp.]|nr:hypothetical protein [Haliscomenobacter sp.]